MRMVLRRRPQDPNSTPGDLYVDGTYYCVTIELPEKDGGQGSAIPAGSYEVRLYQSPHFGRQMPLLWGVPGRALIEIHWGNFPKDTRGCILVGKERSTDAIWHSEATFDALYLAILPAVEAEGCLIEIQDPLTNAEQVMEAATGEN